MNFSAPLPTSSGASGAAWGAGVVIGGRYRLLKRLGAGGMGEVWLAEHLTLGTTAAVKLVDIAARDNAPEILRRFELEARAAAQLRSSHVVQILDHGVDGHIAFMVMELLEGEGLESRMERRGALPPDEVAYILTEVTRGVDRAHAAGIIHRDLKPSNIFLARQPDGLKVAKVLDFGIAKVLGTPRSASVQTQAGVVIGTPSYMSPEQVLGRPLDVRSDLWSLGVIAFECLCGRRLFEGETLGAIFMLICSAPLPVPSAVALVPPGFDAWFQRALSRDPTQRFQTATEFSDALRGSLGLANTPLMLGLTSSAGMRSSDLGMSGRISVLPVGAMSSGTMATAGPKPRSAAVIVASLLSGLMVALAVAVVWKLSAGHAPVVPLAPPAPTTIASVETTTAVLPPPDPPPSAAPIPVVPSVTSTATASPPLLKSATPRAAAPLHDKNPENQFGF